MSILRERQTVYFDGDEHAVLILAHRQMLLDAIKAKLVEEGESSEYIADLGPESVGVLQRSGDPGVFITVQEIWPDGLDPNTPYVAPTPDDESAA